MLKPYLFMTIIFTIGITACTNSSSDDPGTTNPPSMATQRPGSDRDVHGCIPSAGYSWCTSTKRCERPWELAKAQNFENSREAFDKYCKNSTSASAKPLPQ